MVGSWCSPAGFPRRRGIRRLSAVGADCERWAGHETGCQTAEHVQCEQQRGRAISHKKLGRSGGGTLPSDGRESCRRRFCSTATPDVTTLWRSCTRRCIRTSSWSGLARCGAMSPLISQPATRRTPSRCSGKVIFRWRRELRARSLGVPLNLRTTCTVTTARALLVTKSLWRAWRLNRRRRRSCDSHPLTRGEIELIAVGPMTNIALALALEPELPRLVRGITIMGGAALAPGNVTPAAEANIWCDPEAAAAVFNAPWRLRMVGLDVTMRTLLTEADRQ